MQEAGHLKRINGRAASVSGYCPADLSPRLELRAGARAYCEKIAGSGAVSDYATTGLQAAAANRAGRWYTSVIRKRFPTDF